MYKIGDWVVRTFNGGALGEVGAMAKVIRDVGSYVAVDRPFLSNSFTSWDKIYIRKATKLELLLNGIDTEQETSYTDIKENDT